MKTYIRFAILIAMSAPCLLTFNGNMECWFYNLIGIAYSYWFGKNIRNLFVNR